MSRTLLSAALLMCGGCAGSAVTSKPPMAGALASMPTTVPLRTSGGATVGTVHLMPGKPPALWPVHSINGLAVTRAYPFRDDIVGEEQDHAHHRSMWMAHGAVNGVDFWHGPGCVEHEKIEELSSGGIVVNSRWLDTQGAALLTSRTVFSSQDRDDVRFVNMAVALTPVDRPVHFGDTKEGSMAIRLAPELRLEGPVANGTLANSEGVTGKAVWGKAAKQIQIAGRIDGKPITVKASFFSRFDKGPIQAGVRWHARPYGLIAANPFADRAFDRDVRDAGGLTLEPGHTLQMFLVLELCAGTCAGEGSST